MESRMTKNNRFNVDDTIESRKRSFLARSFEEESPLQSVIDLLFYTMQIEETPFITIDIEKMDSFVVNRLRSICMLSFQSNYTKMIEEVNNDPTIKALWMKFKIEEVSHKIVFEFIEESEYSNRSIFDAFPERNLNAPLFYSMANVFVNSIDRVSWLFLEDAIVTPTISHENQFITFAEGVNTYEFFRMVDEIVKYENAGFFEANGMKVTIPQSYIMLYLKIRDAFLNCIDGIDFKYFSIVSPITGLDPNEKIELISLTFNEEKDNILGEELNLALGTLDEIMNQPDSKEKD